jgi:hypothetical protein
MMLMAHRSGGSTSKTAIMLNNQAPTTVILLERSAVPDRFPQFRNTTALAHLAHTARGPRYVLIGGKAWYDPRDIYAWLEENKRKGPQRPSLTPQGDQRRTSKPAPLRKRGRPTKLEQMMRARNSNLPA